MVGYCTKLTFTVNRKRWIFPNDRFTEYEQKDEVWARVLGYGHEEGNDQEIIIPCAMIESITVPESSNNLIKTNINLIYIGNVYDIVGIFK